MGLGGAVVEVDGADHDHGQRDDDRDGASDGAADGAEEKEDYLHHEVDHVPARLVRVADPAKQGVV